MTYFEIDSRNTDLYIVSGKNNGNNSTNDLANLIGEKLRQLGIAIDLIKEKGHLEEYKKRIVVGNNGGSL